MTDARKTGEKIVCVPIKESDRIRFMLKMSSGCKKISEETKWSERGFIPSFEVTDKILMESARRTYKILGLSDR